MSKTKLQKKREYIANLCDEIAGKKSISGNQLRRKNRKVDFKKSKKK